MKAMEDLREKLCSELEKIALEQKMGAGDLEAVHKLTDTIKNIDKICMMEEGGYSRDGDWEAELRGSYGRGSSYARNRRRDSMGRYSRDGGSSYGRGGRGYSRGGEKEQMMEQLERMMDSAGSEKERNAIRQCLEQLENA